MENESSIKEIIRTSLEQVRTIVDADTIIGKQITTPSGVVIIPISKVSMGFASGGLDVPAKKEEAKKNFGGGGGTGVTVSPVGFLTVTPDGVVELIPMVPEKTSPIEQLADIIDNAPSVISRIKDIFADVLPEKKEEPAKEADDDLEKLYEQKLIEEANDGTDEIVDEAEKILEEDEYPLSKDEVKRLKKEAKERRKLEKKAEKSGEKKVDSLEADPFTKKGKLSEKTIENGIVK